MAEQLDAQLRLALISDHYHSPRHFGAIEGADVVMPGGNPGCGDVVVVYLKANGDRIEAIGFEGRGCTVSQAGTSMLLEDIIRRGLSAQEIAEMDYRYMEELLGSDVVRARPRCATLGLATLKGAVRAWHKKQASQAAGVAVAATPSADEVKGFVLGDEAFQAAGGGLPHDWPPLPPSAPGR